MFDILCNSEVLKKHIRVIDEYFTIAECIARDPPVYRIDCGDEVVKGTF